LGQLIGLARSSWYYEPLGESAENQVLMREIDRRYIKRPFFGTRKVREHLGINRKRAQRLMRLLGLEALDAALVRARPEIFNTDQGAQFTATGFTSRLEKSGVAISMDGRGRALDNVFVERPRRTVKYEEVYRRDYADGWQAEKSLGKYVDFYHDERPHQALGYRTALEVYAEG
jgi:putative transposase